MLSKKIYVPLEFIRGIAALVVMWGHLRGFIFVNYADLSSNGYIQKAFYFITGFGHEAVMIFFVLSGFLISKSIENMVGKNYWSWKIYLVNRLSRLWAALIPALILTIMWDNLGMYLSHSEFYQGNYFELYASGPTTKNYPQNYSLSTFISNIFFLQTITTTTYGTNAPLWSLSNEFWYYIIFPLAYMLLVTNNYFQKSIYMILLIMIYMFLPNNILLLGIVWGFGYIVHIIEKHEIGKKWFENKVLFIASLAIFLSTLVAARMRLLEGFTSDLIIGASFSLFMLTILHQEIHNKVYISISSFLSNISYTLYVVHFPFMAFLCCVVLKNKKYDFYDGIAIYLVIFTITIFYSYAIYFLFEKNTHILKRIMIRYTPQ